jgi:predicted nuclease of restriction endonuclease-like (RecB) superfamily
VKCSLKQNLIETSEYRQFVEDLKSRILSARISASRAVNCEQLLLYWDIGRGIVEKQSLHGWGDGIVQAVAADLRLAFPGVTGFSARNVWDMRRLFQAYSDPQILRHAAAVLGKPRSVKKQEPVTKTADNFLRQLVAVIPWGQHLTILNKVNDPEARLYYLRATAHYGWSRNVLLNQIKADAFERSLSEGKTHNFPAVLPEYLAEQAQEALKSSYNLEFLGINRAVKERELEDRLIERLREFILELGYGFCFMGRQYRLAIGRKEYFIDLLFYHRFLKSLVAVELKVGPFEPEHAGKMDFYLNLLNEKERASDDNPSIGIILCAEKDSLEVEFALKSKTNPIGVAEYQLQPRLPPELKGKLPTPKQLTDVLRSILPEKRGERKGR